MLFGNAEYVLLRDHGIWLPPLNELDALTGPEAVQIFQFEATDQMLGEPCYDIAARRDHVVATSGDDVDAELAALEGILRDLTARPSVNLIYLPTNCERIAFYLDDQDATEWRPMAICNEERILHLESGWALVGAN
ncbi:MAG: hypothetical protein HKN60_03930 [Rhizobiales bacterium]|nr:hypothetical protein [Hyphomicrobiales bacterium]